MAAFYLDDFSLITAEETASADFVLFINDEDASFSLKKEKGHLFLITDHRFCDGDSYSVLYRNHFYPVIPRFIVQSEEFDACYRCDVGTLGSFVTKEKTIFRLWTPLSKEAFVVIDGKSYEMDYKGKGIYEREISQNKEGSFYHYEIVREKRFSFRDPFAYACKDERDAWILDKEKLRSPHIPAPAFENAFIYECHVRDFSQRDPGLFACPGKLKAFTEEGLNIDGLSIGADYLKDLGITHLQLLPLCEYDLDHADYNWGYNPLSFNFLHPAYFCDHAPYGTIREMQEVVAFLHKKGIRLCMDVVYNHVYNEERFDLCEMLPYYFLRYKDGKKGDAAYCGNEFRSEAPFSRDYLTLIVNRLIDLYDIDGLRFDLMGILDIETMKAIQRTGKTIKADLLLYGEGWNMGEILPFEKRACKENAEILSDYAFFNDSFRNAFRAYAYDDFKGFLFGEMSLKEEIKKLLSGKILREKQSLNYVECHDNYTLYDKACCFSDDEKIRTAICELGLAMCVLSKGIPFLHAGQEFLLSKSGIDNSYNAPLTINGIDWRRRVRYDALTGSLKRLIAFRKEYASYWKEEMHFEDYYEVLIVHLGDLTLFVNSCIFDHIYRSDKRYVLFEDNGFSENEVSAFVIPCFHVVMALEKNV